MDVRETLDGNLQNEFEIIELGQKRKEVRAIIVEKDVVYKEKNFFMSGGT